jgi:hypothetical protein
MPLGGTLASCKGADISKTRGFHSLDVEPAVLVWIALDQDALR